MGSTKKSAKTVTGIELLLENNENLEGGDKSLDVSHKSCKFCNVSAERGFRVHYEDDFFVAFEDRSPASRYHYLVVPKKHIVKTMEEIGNSMLNNLEIPTPLRVSAVKYPVRSGFNGHSKGLTWFAEVKQTIQILERGRLFQKHDVTLFYCSVIKRCRSNPISLVSISIAAAPRDEN
ncbi:hypothetical protein CVT25_000556 [Psilocybe cyanescens]|uniref:HIT domain-containing protein n=1 Tax=Psilocybe cyanescens TaxID=93625 RepID=A0A409WZS9_PSICY|nr:hypothetical protein CVT25_000556 [Psilocybe cyanescens]